MNNTDRNAVAKGKEIFISRVLNASPERVFEAFTTPQQVAVWWGPNGFTNTISEMDVKPGGVWRFIMHGPDGRDYPNKIVFIDVVKNEKLVYRHTGDDGAEPVKIHVTIDFENVSGKTKITMRSVFESEAELDRVVKEYGALEGATENMNRLEEYLAKD
jgi:uncharacterized protein YndB with AHSA1/START domain